jgi:hypothetical protein
MSSIKEYYAQLLFANLQGSSPVATGNMKGRITFTKYGPDVFEITVSPGVPYAFWTNVKKNGPRQRYNYLWINRSVKATLGVLANLYGAKIDDKL